MYYFLKTFFHCLCPFLSFDDFQNRPVLISSQQKVILSCDYDHSVFIVALVLDEYLSSLSRYKRKGIIIVITPCNTAY